MINKIKVSCIVPAYNEEKRIGAVLKVLNKISLIDELIIVNDGSKDNTLKEMKKFKSAKIINYKKNCGKSYAVMRGIKYSKNRIILLIDSDLIGLTEKNISELVFPVLSGKADMSISLRKNSAWIYRVLGLDFVSGERVFDKNILGNINAVGKLTSYGLESFINKKAIDKKLRISVVKWNNVRITSKTDKIGFLRGVAGELKMTNQIIKTTGLLGLFKIFIQMKKLIVN